MKGHCARLCAFATLFIFFFPSTLIAQTSSVTDRVTLAGTDFIDWEALDDGVGDFTLLAGNPDTVASNNGVSVTVSTLQGNTPVILVDGGPHWVSNFPDGDYLLSTNAANNNANDVVFSDFDGEGVCGLGAQVTTAQQLQTGIDSPGFPDYSVRITALDDAMALLGSHVIAGDFDLEAPFVGIESTQAMHYVAFSIETLEVPDPWTAFFAVNQVDFRLCDADPPPQEGLNKFIVAGNDFDTDNVPDRVIEAGSSTPAMYTFELAYGDEDEVVIKDVVPGEWDAAVGDLNELNCTAGSANGKDNGKGATKIDCAATGPGVTEFEAIARCNDKNGKCKPDSCGAVYLNPGALAYLPGENGKPTGDPVAGSSGLCLAVVEDLGSDGIDYTGEGDEDGDNLTDYAEACELGYDPCNADTDGDGASDDVDVCPLDPNDEC